MTCSSPTASRAAPAGSVGSLGDGRSSPCPRRPRARDCFTRSEQQETRAVRQSGRWVTLGKGARMGCSRAVWAASSAKNAGQRLPRVCRERAALPRAPRVDALTMSCHTAASVTWATLGHQTGLRISLVGMVRPTSRSGGPRGSVRQVPRGRGGVKRLRSPTVGLHM